MHSPPVSHRARAIALFRGSSFYRGPLSLPVGGPLVAVGWGATAEGGFGSDVPRQVVLPMRADTDCNAIFPGTMDVICAGGEAGMDTCQGTRAGPLAACCTSTTVTAANSRRDHKLWVRRLR
eukprot:scaffold28105_cov139-Isochrysis_galbana.AAC.6